MTMPDISSISGQAGGQTNIAARDVNALYGDALQAKMFEHVVDISSRLTRIETQVGQIHERIYGNGSPGLCAQIEAVTHEVDALRDQVSKLQARRSKGTW